MTVVDASAIVDLLAPPDAGRRDRLLGELPDPGAPWLAPDLLVFEVFAVLRRHVLRRVLPDAAAARALQRLRRLPIELMPASSLLAAAWPLRDTFSAAGSLYAALALRAGEPLLTTDRRLARAASAAGVELRLPA
jgi:predicted nucleic acid-binding protein